MEAGAGDTSLGYWAWVSHQVELAMDERDADGYELIPGLAPDCGLPLEILKVPAHAVGELVRCATCATEVTIQPVQAYIARTLRPVCGTCIENHKKP